MVKRYADPRHTTVSYEKGLLTDITIHHLFELDDLAVVESGLEDPRPASPKMLAALSGHLFVDPADVQTSRKAFVRCRAVCMGDIVAFVSGGAITFGEVFFHCKVSGHLWSCIGCWQVREMMDASAKCLVVDAPAMVQTCHIIEPCIAFKASPGHVSTVIFPPRLRARSQLIT
eukprot:7137964-Pyramimonas_sp.AAC.1